MMRRIVLNTAKSSTLLGVNMYAEYLVLLSRIFGFWQVSVKAGSLSTVIGDKVRQKFYGKMLDHVGTDTRFVYGCNFSYQNVSVGKNVRIGYGTCVGLADIGDHTRIGSYCCLLSGSRMHGMARTDVPMREQPGVITRIHIGTDCWLGAQTVIMADVGQGAVVGSGAVVTKAIPPMSIAVGVPAKVIGHRYER